MASPPVRAAYRVDRRARKEGQPVPEETRRILNEYKRPGRREYQRQKRARDHQMSPKLFQALRDRGIPAILINRHSKQLRPSARYLIVSTIIKNGRKTLWVYNTNTKSALIAAVAAVPHPAVVIDTKEIY